MAGGISYNVAQLANQKAISDTLQNPSNYEPGTILPGQQKEQILVKPQDPSGYGYSHGPSGPKQSTPKIIESSYDSSTDNPNALGNGLVSLSNQQINEKNNSTELGNGLISLSNKQTAEKNNSIALGNGLISLSNQQIQQKNQLIEQSNKNQAIDYSIDLLASRESKPFSIKDFISAGKREDKLSNNLNVNGIEAYGSDVSNKPQLGGLQAIPRYLESTVGSYSAGIESAFVNAGKEVPSNWLKSGSISKPISIFGSDVLHTFLPLSLTNLATKHTIEGRSVKLTPEASAFETRTSAPSSLGYLMGKEPLDKNANKEYYDVQMGFMIASSVYGLKGPAGVVPLRMAKIPLPIGEGGSAQIATKALILGYGGKGSRFLIGKSEKGFYMGTPSPEQLPFEKLTPTTTRYGFEVAANKPIVNKYLTSEPVLQNLVKTGKLSNTGYLDIAEMGREGLPLAAKSPSVIHSNKFPVNTIEGLTPEQTNVLFENLKATHTEAKGSLVQVPFSKIFNPQTGKFVFRPAKDIDILNVSAKQATKNNLVRADLLNKVAQPGQTFVAKGTELGIKTKTGAITEYRKLIEHPEHTGDELGSPMMNIDFTFGEKTPTGTIKYQGIRLNKYNFQIFRKVASSTEYHIGQEGKIDVRAASGRETKDPTDVYGAYKTKAYNYMQQGNMKDALRLNEIAEKYRARHKEIDFEKSMVEPGTVTITSANTRGQSASIFGRSTGKVMSNFRNLFSPKYPSGFKSPSGNFKSGFGSIKSPSSPSSSPRSPILVSPKSTFSSGSTKSIKSIKSPSGFGSPSGYGSPKGRGSPTSPSGFGSPSLRGLASGFGSPSPKGTPGSPGSPGGRSPPGSPLRPSPHTPPLPPGSPNKFPKPLFKFGALTPKRKGKGRFGPTRTYLHEVNNIFAASLSIKRLK